MKILSVQNVEELSFELARITMSWNEPIPAFDTRLPGRLESCLLTPFQTFGGKDMYPSLIDKAAQLFYFLIKNHPFQNGNKRLAVASLFIFLYLNDHWINFEPDELYQLAVFVAASPPNMREGVIVGIKGVLRKNLISLK